MPVGVHARWLVLVIALIAPTTAWGFTLEEYTFEDPARKEAFRELIGQTRCLVCQNESLAGSQAGLAQDLRDEIYRLMQEGRSREEVVDFLVARYGDFVLYEPPLKLATLPIWIAPLVLAILGVVILRRALLNRQRDTEADLAPEEEARLKRLLARTRDPQDPH